MSDYQGILIYDEIADGRIGLTTRELLAAGRKLADELQQPLSAVLIGKGTESCAGEVISLGADHVYTIENSPHIQSSPDLYVALMEQVCKQLGPAIVITGYHDMGRDTVIRIAARTGASLSMDCIQLKGDAGAGKFTCVKPVYGGNAIAVWASGIDKPNMVTLRQRSVQPAEPDAQRKGEVHKLDITIDDAAMKVTLQETVKEEIKGIKLEDAKVVVAGGSGMGNADGFKILEELAELMGAAVGATRVPCDEGWKPMSIEIGQTGRIVTPDLYIAVGISGAPQHMAGCSGAKKIVAINRDPDAHIFEEADFGLIGDYKSLLPPFIEHYKKMMNQ
jgi:electron transfer flavoprotein alpha subunit